jgi:excisionase family DNA binding protein
MSNTTGTLERRALSVGETGRAIGLSRATIYRLIEQKQLVTLKVGSRRLIPVAAIDAFLEKAAAK